MPIKVAVIFTRKFRGRVKVCPDLVQGIERVGDRVVKVRAEDYREPVSDVAIFYGFDGSRDSRIAQAFADYKRADLKAIYVDLGYWSQRWNGDRYGFHRFALNDRHPTAYFQNRKHNGDRFKVHGKKFGSRHDGRNILVCGMSEKCAVFEGFKFEEWERDAIKRMGDLTDRPIVYRPKPRRKTEPQYPRIEGVGFSDPSRKRIEEELRDAFVVVSHHSNACIDGILAGVPCIASEGVASVFGNGYADLEQPRFPSDDERRQWAFDIAYCQFNRPEMRDGTAWHHFKDEGLVP